MTELKDDVHGPLALMDTVFQAGGNLPAEYPLVFQRGFEGRLVALDAGTEVVSSCAVLPRTFVVPGARLTIGLIGSVATAADQRGKGLASHVLARAEGWLAERGATLSLLWADDARFYVARGYRPIGAELVAVLDRVTAAALPSWPDVRVAGPADAAAIHALYASLPVRVERTPAETRALLACPRMSVLVAERDGATVAYVCTGRGRDLAGVLHEWAGLPDAVLGLLGAAAAGRDADPLFVMAPDHPSIVTERLAAAGVATHRGHLGLGKLLAGDGPATRIAETIENLAGGRLEASSSRADARTWRWSGPRGAVELDAHQLVEILVGPRGTSPALESARTATGLTAEALPLKPFAWGLDSI